jgi:hypothetical protein
MWALFSEHFDRHWLRVAGTNAVILTAAQFAAVESILKIAVLAATLVLTVLGCYYKVKKNGKDAA